MSDTEHLKVQILLGPKAEDNKNQDWLRGMLDALIAEAQREALEKAVKVCASLEGELYELCAWSESNGAGQCKEAIRELLPSEKLPYCACCQNTGTDPGDSAMTCPECQGTVRES